MRASLSPPCRQQHRRKVRGGRQCDPYTPERGRNVLRGLKHYHRRDYHLSALSSSVLPGALAGRSNLAFQRYRSVSHRISKGIASLGRSIPCLTLLCPPYLPPNSNETLAPALFQGGGEPGGPRLPFTPPQHHLGGLQPPLVTPSPSCLYQEPQKPAEAAPAELAP